MASVARPLLLAFVAPAAPAVVILVLLFTFQAGSDGDAYVLTGVKGPLFLLLASLSLIACLLVHKQLNELLLYWQAWRVVKRGDILRSAQAADPRRNIRSGTEGVHMDFHAIAFLNGSLPSFRRYLSKSRRRDNGISASSLIVSGAFWSILFVLFALLVAAWIWLHVTVQIDNLVSTLNSQMSSPGHGLGRVLSASCTQNAPQTGSWQIALNDDLCTDRFDIVQDDTEAYDTLSGNSTLNRVTSIPQAYNGQDVAIMTDAEAETIGAYAADTYGIVTACQPIPDGCNLNTTSGQYDCSASSFTGYVTDGIVLGTPSLNGGTTSFFVAAQISNTNSSFNDSLSGQATALSPAKDSLLLALSCTTQALEVPFFVRSSLPGAETFDSVDDQGQWLLLAPMFPGQVVGYGSFGSAEIVANLAAVASAGSVQTPQDLANEFATIFSQAAISSAAGILVPSDSQDSQSAVSSGGSATVLMKGPVFMIVILDLIHTLLACLLGIAAVVIELRDKRVAAIRSQLTYQGALAATLAQESSNSSEKSRSSSTREIRRSNSQRSSSTQGSYLSTAHAAIRRAHGGGSRHASDSGRSSMNRRSGVLEDIPEGLG